MKKSEGAFGRDWVPVGQEPHPIGSITECVILRSRGVSVVSLPNGDIDAERHPSTGMYHNDTRYLSRLCFSLGGIEPVILDATLSSQVQSEIFTNRAMVSPKGGDKVPAQALIIRRRRLILDALHESLAISNYSGRKVRVELRIEFDADFRDIFEVRGYERQSARAAVKPTVRDDGVTYAYTGADGQLRRTELQFSRCPDEIHAHGAGFDIELEPRETVVIDTRAGADRLPTAQAFDESMAQKHAGESAFLAELTQIETDNGQLNDALRSALLDIQALRTVSEGETYMAAGVPWFDTLFGRDSLIAGMLMAPFSTELLRTSLVLLAKYQSAVSDPSSDATPGKIPHELRWGELAQIGEVPFGRYYGSVDSTPLFLAAAGEYLDWSCDLDTLRDIWPAIVRAKDWCEATSAKNGFLTYERTSAIGLENQGWKDSHDAIVWPDGEMVKPPISLVEVQGYLVAGLTAFARIAEELNETGAQLATAEADGLRQRIEQHFGLDGQGYALCLDGKMKAVPTAASNQGHLLTSGAASEHRAAEVARRLLAEDMFSGWGVRTLSTTATTFNPLGYHTGSVWPHDNAMIIGGLRRYGHDAEAQQVATAFIEAALSFPAYQVPELFSGDERGLRLVPTPYPVASRPQAWSAATLPYVIASLLGLRPRRTGIAVIRPVLPNNITWARVRNLHCQGGSVDLVFRRQGDRTSVEVEQIRGDVDVVLSNR